MNRDGRAAAPPPVPQRSPAGEFLSLASVMDSDGGMLGKREARVAGAVAALLAFLAKATGKAGAGRPVLAQLLADARAHKFEAVVVWKLHRFGRSLTDLLDNTLELDRARVRLIVPIGLGTAARLLAQ